MAHIGLIISDLGGGGAERVVIALARGFCDRGHRVDIVLFAPAVAYAWELPEAARLFVLGDRAAREERKTSDIHEGLLWWDERSSIGRAVLSAARSLPACIRDAARREALRLAGHTLRHRHARARGLRLLAYVERERPDILFTNLPYVELPTFFGAMLARRRPSVAPIMHNVERLRRKYRERRRRVLRSVPAVVAVSHGVADNIAAVHGVRRDRIATIYNPAFTPDIAVRARAEPDHPWFADGGPPVILGVGRLHPQKDFPTLIDAFRLVSAERPCRLVILGEGPVRGEIEGRVEALGLEDCVSLPGWVGNPFAFMARASLFVLSSQHEGFGNVLVEAMACGCPAVSTDCPSGPAEILEDPALLAPVGNPKALACVMLRALDRPVDKEALRSRAARFSVERAVDGYEAVIDRALREQAGRNA